MTRQTNDAYIVSIIFTTKLCSQTNTMSFFQYLLFKFYIAECTSVFITCSR